MTWILSFPGNKEAEPYTGLETWEDVCEAVRKEIRTSIEDMGSEGCDPTQHLPENFNAENDPNGERWNDAMTAAIDDQVDNYFPRIESRLSTVGEARLPDMTWIALHTEDEDAALSA